MKFNILVTLFLSFFLVGCATKREYFSPTDEQVLGKHNYDKSLNNENIAYITAEGATLKDGSVITKSGYLSKIKLDKKEKFLTIADNKVISSNIDGTLKIRDLDGNLLFEHKFLVQALSANLRGDDLALVTANNALHLIKVSTKTVVLTERGEPTLAYDSRLAKPLFAGSGIVLYPMLDGRVAIAHLPSGSMVQDLYISNEPFFNSVIFLEIAGDNMYAATATALLMNSSVGNKSGLSSLMLLPILMHIRTF